MSRLGECFHHLREAGRTGLIPFVTAGDPSPTGTVDLLHALVRGGADAIELGMPFSDPMADGPVIQAANERALARGVKLTQILTWVQEFRQRDAKTPVILMGYLNPMERFGVQKFAHQAAAAGVDGLIVVDLTPEEARAETKIFQEAGIDLIFLLAPTSGPDRIATVKGLGSGFVYYVSLRGITGATQQDWTAVRGRVASLRRELALPVAVGFGIRDAETAAQLAGEADAVVIGSALVEYLQTAENDQAAQVLAEQFLRPIRQALTAKEIA
ncbi:MAG: tryptophan synthase subunit alpha [Acidithiobacillus sp.]|nr:tryptophan synthase subunit alpha [Acidithiobacillus sp.]